MPYIGINIASILQTNRRFNQNNLSAAKIHRQKANINRSK
jgi:hypothetical protein